MYLVISCVHIYMSQNLSEFFRAFILYSVIVKILFCQQEPFMLGVFWVFFKCQVFSSSFFNVSIIFSLAEHSSHLLTETHSKIESWITRVIFFFLLCVEFADLFSLKTKLFINNKNQYINNNVAMNRRLSIKRIHGIFSKSVNWTVPDLIKKGNLPRFRKTPENEWFCFIVGAVFIMFWFCSLYGSSSANWCNWML